MDCFSRAGLKEFWLYIWNLNNNLFPLNTTTYPITRGIRVEIACIVLIFFVGIMSQMKLWKVIKARRDNKELLHLQDEERRNQAEEDLGRRLEEGNEIEREQWEAIYGNKELAARQLTDSSIGTDGIESVRKESTSAFTAREVQDSPTEIIEMHELEPLVAFSQDESNRGKGIEKSRIIVRVANDEETSPEPVVDQSDCLSQVSASTRVSEQSVETAHQDSASPQPADKEKLTETQLAANPVPDIIPLPFNVPVVHRGNNKDLISSATFAASDDHRLPLSQRFSTSTSRRVRSRGSQHNSTIPSISQEALLIAHSDDDQDSSAAATVDDFAYDSDVKARDMISVPRSDSHGAVSSISAAELEQPENSQLFESDDITEQHYNAQAAKLSSQSSSKITAQVLVSPSSPDDAVESWEGSVSAGGRPVIEEQRTYDEVFPVRASVSDANEAHATNDSMTTSEDSKKAPSNSNLYGRLPEHTSKVVTAYRTNEWAKHLDRAQKPELDELGTSNNPQASGLTLVEEAPAPVYISELQQTGFDGGQLKRSSQTPSRHSNRIAPKQRAWFAASEDPSQQSQGNPGQSNLSPRVERSPSQVSLSGTSAKNAMPLSVLTKPGTHHSSTPTGRGLRSSSTPLVSRTSIESPIEEDVEASFPPRSTLTMIPTNTLIAKRENMARSRFSSLTVNQLQHSPPSSTPNSRSRSPSLDDDNISLSHRKSLLHQNQQHRQSSLPTQLPQQPPGDSRSSLLATWRDSVAQNLNATHQPDQEAETRRREMLDEKHRSRINQHQATVATNRKGTMVEQAMRRGSMLDAHREAMRRMQGVANRGL
ncbi:hypothetical protein MMC12_000653 [Toensbergia leucococca]|nr:hypothetical protein [Toensbergia leucococca]